MTDFPLSDADAPAALTAFLRGIERRGAVFAELLVGDALRAEQAFAVALRQFRDHALAQPFAHWSRLFWRTLLASPKLRAPAPASRWEGPFAALAPIGGGPRAALLLRLVAGLTDADAAAALGIAPPTYRLALRQALPHREDGSADPEAWRALAEAVQQAIRGLPAERLAHLARLRQAAVQGRRPELIGPLHVPAPEAEPEHAPARHRRLRALLWAGVAACGVGLAVTFLWPPGWSGEGGDPGIRIRPLGPAQSPAARFDAATALLTERDFEVLAAGPLAPPLDDPAFYAWYAASRGGEIGAPDPEAEMGEAETGAPSTAPQLSESIDAP